MVISVRRRLRKQITILAILTAVLFGIGTAVFVIVYEPPPPPPPPLPTYASLVVRSVTLIRTAHGSADLLALVANPNAGAGVRDVPFTFEIRSGGVLLASVPGRTFFLPGQEKPLVALGVLVPKEASEVAVTFGSPVWSPVSPGFRGPALVPVNRTAKILDGASPAYEVKGVLANESDLDFQVVEVTALGLTAKQEVLGVGHTFIGSLRSRERREFTVSWPLPAGEVVSEVRVYPGVNVFSL